MLKELAPEPEIEYPDAPIPNHVTIEADRALVAAKRKLAAVVRYDEGRDGHRTLREITEFLPQMDLRYWEAFAELMEAETHCYELGLHNRLFQLGMAIRAQQTLIATPSSIPPGGGRRM